MLKTKGLGSKGRAFLPFLSTLGRVPGAGFCGRTAGNGKIGFTHPHPTPWDTLKVCLGGPA